MKTKLSVFFSIVLFIVITSCKKHTCDVGIGSYSTNIVGQWQMGNLITTYSIGKDSTFKDSTIGVKAPNDTASGTWAFDGYFLNKTYNKMTAAKTDSILNFDVKQMCPTTYQMTDDFGVARNGTRLK